MNIFKPEAVDSFSEQGVQKECSEGVYYPSSQKSDPEVFRAVLYPPKSLSRSGEVVIMAVFIIYGALMGLFFLAQGAWPISGFFGLEIALLLFLFWYHRRASSGFESIVLSLKSLKVSETSYPAFHQRRCKTWLFEPAWVHILLSPGRDDKGELKILSHGKGLAIGEYLTYEEKRDLTDALRLALEKRKQKLTEMPVS